MPSAKETEVNDKFVSLIAARSGGGILGLSRNFRIIDKDRSGQLSKDEFKLALKKFRIALEEDEKDILFNMYDEDNSGSLAFDEFLKGLRGKMSQQRRELTEQAFAKMDKDGSGQIDFKDLETTFDTSKHPKVISGEMTHQQVINEFLNEFDGASGDNNNVVTLEEFMDYHVGLSSNIDHDDAYGEMLARNWGITYIPKRELNGILEAMRAKCKQKSTASKSEKAVAKDILKKFDLNGSGEIDYKEFQNALKEMGGDGFKEIYVETLFGMFDHDNSGEISTEEVLNTVFEKQSLL